MLETLVVPQSGLALRTVALRDALQMVGDHHMPAGRRHWRATASSFAIMDHHRNPLVWVEGDQVVGDLAAVAPAPESGGYMEPGFTPPLGETLMWFEVVPCGGAQMIRTWWARGENLRKTIRIVRLEPLTAAWPERIGQLVKLMNRGV